MRWLNDILNRTLAVSHNTSVGGEVVRFKTETIEAIRTKLLEATEPEEVADMRSSMHLMETTNILLAEERNKTRAEIRQKLEVE